MIVYFDMDGVLTKYDEALSSWSYVDLMTIKQDRALRSKIEEDRKQDLGSKHYETLEPNNLPDFTDLMRSLKSKEHKIEILTSLGLTLGNLRNSDLGADAFRGKQNWLRSFYGRLFNEGVITGFNAVSSCVQKQFFAGKDSFLIDDQIDNIMEFTENNGHAIQYGSSSHASIIKHIREVLCHEG